MKLTLRIKLLPTPEQGAALLATLREANRVCNLISAHAFREKVFNAFKLHGALYHTLRKESTLTAQHMVRCFGKVADSYKLDKKAERSFKALGSIAYDSRILSYNHAKVAASLSTVQGRMTMPYQCHKPEWLQYIKGEADLVLLKGKWFLFQTIDIPDADIEQHEDVLGVDLGITDIATLSDGTTYSSKQLQQVRNKYHNTRSSIQTKADNSPRRSTRKGCRRLLKRLSGRERRFATITNHTISKAIVAKAKSESQSIAMENLTGIRQRTKQRGAEQRRRHSSWAFFQLKSFVRYKAELSGVRLIEVNPAYTSKSCCKCGVIGKRSGKHFKCINSGCGVEMDADINGAVNISRLGYAVTVPETPSFFCELDRCKAHAL